MNCAKIKNKILHLIFSALIFFIFSCSNNKYKSDIIPGWYINPKNNDNNFLYGTGSGYSNIEAKNNALLDASHRLSSIISGKTNIINKENNYDISQELYQDITSETLSLTFNNYQITNSIKIGEIIYNEISINKNEFYQNCIKIITDLDQEIRNLDLITKQSNSITRLNNLAKIKNNITEIKKLSNIVKYDYDKIYYSKLANEYLAIKENIEFYIYSDITDFKQLITKFLNQQNFKIARNRSKKNKRNQIEVTIKTSNIYNYIYNNHIINYKIAITLSNNNNKLSNNIINVTGSSPISKNLAKRAAIYEFEQKLKGDYILKLLNIM